MNYFFDASYSGYLPADDFVMYRGTSNPITTFGRVGGYAVPAGQLHPSFPETRLKCVICLGEGTNGNLCVPTHRCNHSRCICESCRTRYLNNMICMQGITRVGCPQSGCRERFSEADIERWGDAASISRYKYLSGIRRSAAEHYQRSAARGPSRDKRADERASADYIRTHTKPCPGCSAPIVKFGDGCDHMKCAPPGGCGFEFCWLCLCDFEPVRQDGNHRHESSCKHYRPIC